MSGELPQGVDELARLGRVHMVGIGGAGMSAVAALLAARGLEVSGSDRSAGAAVERLRGQGIVVAVGHDAANVDGAGAVVVSTAIRPTNPELVRARELGLPVLHRSQALAALMAGRRGVAVAGAHGKTTTSAMVAVLLTHAGLDPTVAVGGDISAWGPGTTGAPGALGGAREGRGDVVVVEADESDGSFLAYRPFVAVVTNVEPDHLDHYGSREAFEAAFEQFVQRIEPGGWLVACADDAGSAALARFATGAGVQVLTYGTGTDADVRVERAPDGSVQLRGCGGAPCPLRLAVPGEHNVLNATAAWTVAGLLGVDGRVAAEGLAAFAGTGRRFEDRGTAAGVRVVDDYAHHPTEVTALLRAAREVAGDGRVLVLFQPHLYSRTAAFAEEFARALALADEVVVTDVYAAREDPVPGVSGATVTDAMVGSRARFVADRYTAAAELAAEARPGDLVLTVGAGDVTELAPVVLEALRAGRGAGGDR